MRKNGNGSHKVLSHLIRIVIDMPEVDQQNLLEKLERSSLTEMREHLRKPSFIAVDCSSQDVCYTDFIQDISNGGVFIQAEGNFYIGQQITLTFSLPKTKKDITVQGEVVRVDLQGIGVKFNEPLATL
jgi:Tfp pilus assembly protein PilZ